MNSTDGTITIRRATGDLRVWGAAVVAITLLEVGVAAWLRPIDTDWDTIELLQIDLEPDGPLRPLTNSSYAFLPQPKRVAEIADQLSFEKGLCGLLVPQDEPLDSTTRTIELFFFEYGAGNPLFFDDVLGHAPEVCMAASGAILKQVHPERKIVVGDQSLNVRVLEFATPLRSEPLWVYRITWLPPDSEYHEVTDGATMRRERIRGSLLGNPRPPGRVLLAGARNFASEGMAWDTVSALIGDRLFLKGPRVDP